MPSRRDQRMHLLDAFHDQTLGLHRATYDTYLKDPRWALTRRTAEHVFKGRCYVCRMTRRELTDQGGRLTVAHIAYPFDPFDEVIDYDITRSDVVLLCWFDHRAYDAIQDAKWFSTVEDLRLSSVQLLERMRRAARWGKDDED